MAVALVQELGTNDASPTSHSFVSTPTIGSLIVVACAGAATTITGSPSMWTVADNQGNTYTLAGKTRVVGATDYEVAIFYAKVQTASGTFTVTATDDGSTTTQQTRIWISEWTGNWLGNVAVAVGSNSGTAATTGDVTVAVPFADNDSGGVTIAMIAHDNSGDAFSTPTGFTEVDDTTIAIPNRRMAVDYKLATSPWSAETPTWTWATSTDDWLALAVTFVERKPSLVGRFLVGRSRIGWMPNYTVQPSGIATEEAFGTAVLPAVVQPTGIATEEAFGTAQVDQGLRLIVTGIASDEAFGTVQLNLALTMQAIASEEAFGSHTVANITAILAEGIATAEAFGTATLVPGAVTILPSGITSAEAFGTAALAQLVVASGIATAEAFGTAVVQPGAVTLLPSGIVSAEAFGVHVLASVLAPSGIVSAEAFGTAGLSLVIVPLAIVSGETFGAIVLLGGAEQGGPRPVVGTAFFMGPFPGSSRYAEPVPGAAFAPGPRAGTGAAFTPRPGAGNAPGPQTGVSR